MLACLLLSASSGLAAEGPKAWFGVTYQAIDEGLATSGVAGDGVLIVNVMLDSPAYGAGLRPGDLVTAIDGQVLTKDRSLSDIVAASLPGLTVPVTIVREGEILSLRATLAPAPAQIPPFDPSYFEGPELVGEDLGRHTIAGATLATLTPAIAEPLGYGKAARGAVILSVEDGSSAEEIGLQKGDAIFSVNGKRTMTALAAAEAFIGNADGDRAALLFRGRGEHRSFLALPPKPKGWREKWGLYWRLADRDFADKSGNEINRYRWVKRGEMLMLMQHPPGETKARTFGYSLLDDGTLAHYTLVRLPDGGWAKSRNAVIGHIIDSQTVDWVGERRLRTVYNFDSVPYTWTYAEVRRNGKLKEVEASGVMRPVDSTEIARLADAYRKRQAEIARQREAEARARAQQSENDGGSGLGGLLGALGGAMAGISAGGDAATIIGAAASGAAMVDPGSSSAAALDMVGSSLIGGGTPSMGSLGSLGALSGGQGGGSYPTRPNALAGSPACSMMNQNNYRQVATSGGNDVQLKTMCGQAYEYYSMYLNAIRQGYSEADANRTYAAHEQAAQNAIYFYQNNR